MKRALFAAVLTGLLSGATLADAFVWPNVPAEIQRGLGSDDAGERRAAAGRLQELPAELAGPLILSALDDPDVEVRLLAARAAADFHVAGAGERVVPWLGEGEARLRLTACEVIRLVPTPNAVAPLSRVLGDANAHVRIAAAATLGMLGSREAVPSLLGHLDDPSPDVRESVVAALGRIGDPRAVVPLLGKVQDNALPVRRMTVRVLGDLGDPRASSALLLALRDRFEEVRVEAIDSLGRLRSADATSALAPLTRERSSIALRDAAVEALGRIGSPPAVDALMAALSFDDPASERSAVRSALARVGVTVLPRLVSALAQTSSPAMASGAALVLGELGGPSHVQVIVEAMQRGKIPATVALRALAGLGDPAGQPYVFELLDAPSVGVRREAIRAADVLLSPAERDGRAVDPIVARLPLPGIAIDERITLIRLLGRTGSPRAASTLVSLVGAKDERIKFAALQALADVGPAGQDAVLLDALDDTDPSVRLQAAIALSKVAAPSSAPKLLDRLLVASEQDRAAVGIALAGAMASNKDEGLVQRFVDALDRVMPSSRDVLIEGLGRMPSSRAGAALAEVAKRARGVDDRRKVAEALAGHPEQLPLLRRMAHDADPSVQANAVWALGQAGESTDVAILSALREHRDVAVAGNAVAALGRLHARGTNQSIDATCAALSDGRSYVRANALAALALAGKRCGDGAGERAMLASDPAPIVRQRAATLLRLVAGSDAAGDGRALRRCLLDDRSGSVARACREPAPKREARKEGPEPVLVFVVPDGRSTPVARSPYALVFEDGLIRMGLADRRGAVFEGRAPHGQLELAVPATLVR